MSVDMNSRGTGTNKQICDMDEHGEMKADALLIAAQAIDECVEEKMESEYIKRRFDTKFGPTWHVIVGR